MNLCKQITGTTSRIERRRCNRRRTGGVVHAPRPVWNFLEKDGDAMGIRDIWCFTDFTGGIMDVSFCEKFREIYQNLIDTKTMFAKSVELLIKSEEWFEFEEVYRPIVVKGNTTITTQGEFISKKGTYFDEHKIYFYKYRMGTEPQNSGAIQESVVYEEVFHAAQYLHYKQAGKEVTNIEKEVEVRLAKIKENIQDTYTKKYEQIGLLVEYLNGKEFSLAEKQVLQSIILDLGRDIYTAYKESWKVEGKSEEFINKNNPDGINFQFDFLKSLNPNIK